MNEADIGVHTGPALARLPCPTCGTETLFRGVHCIHCGSARRPDAMKGERRRRKDFTVSRKAGL